MMYRKPKKCREVGKKEKKHSITIKQREQLRKPGKPRENEHEVRGKRRKGKKTIQSDYKQQAANKTLLKALQLANQKLTGEEEEYLRGNVIRLGSEEQKQKGIGLRQAKKPMGGSAT